MLTIGNVTLKNNVILAPLAGITNLPFRILAKEAGCGLVSSEMISSNGLVYGSEKTAKLMESLPTEKPLAVQIFGSDPDIMADAARMVADSGADILDINFGCSVRKVVKTGSGVALMRTPGVAEKILKAVRVAINIPLTIKIRTGWDRSGEQAFIIAQIAEESGVDAITCHPRTATQRFGGQADWPLITALKQRLSIPVIGNGDINSAEDAARMLAETGCDGVMIGRAVIGNPFLFTQVVARLAGQPVPELDLDRHFDVLVRFLDASINFMGETHACYTMRSRLGWFVKGMPHSSGFRQSIKSIATRSDALALIQAYRRQVADSLALEAQTC